MDGVGVLPGGVLVDVVVGVLVEVLKPITVGPLVCEAVGVGVTKLVRFSL